MAFEASKLLFIYALTPLHPGTGRVGAPSPVDLPVQRDEFEFPTIWSSSLKGVLRSTFELKARGAQDAVDRVAEEAFVRAVFGPKPASPEVSEYSSSLSLLDARLLFIPARSLRGIWAYLTSPHLLAYYRTYLEVAAAYSPQLGEGLKRLNELIDKVKEKFQKRGSEADHLALVSDEECVLKRDGGLSIVLNEEEFSAELFNDLNKLWEVLPGDVEKKSIAVVSDNAVKGLVKKSLVVQPRIRLGYETKTVAPGGLWDEEYLPQRTLLVTVAFARKPRQSLESLVNRIAQGQVGEQSGVKVEEIAKKALDKLSPLTAEGALKRLAEQRFAVLGGKETIGKGIAKLLWLPAEGRR